MPSGDIGGGKWGTRPGMEEGYDKTRSEASEKIYRTEWNAIIDYLYNSPCIVVWVPFNEGWGQFKTAEITSWTMQKDPSRLVNSASGGSFHEVGQLLDLHNYPGPVMAKPEVFGSKQALVLGEYGGLGLPVEGHTWVSKNNWGYRTFANADTLFSAFKSYQKQLVTFIIRGLSAAVYTQTTDVEIETNGLMTYDRKVIKMPADKLNAESRKLYDAAKNIANNQVAGKKSLCCVSGISGGIIGIKVANGLMNSEIQKFQTKYPGSQYLNTFVKSDLIIRVLSKPRMK